MLDHPGRMIVIGFVLILAGAILPFLMQLKIITTTFFLVFLTYGAQIVGLFLGILGAAMYVRVRRRPKE